MFCSRTSRFRQAASLPLEPRGGLQTLCALLEAVENLGVAWALAIQAHEGDVVASGAAGGQVLEHLAHHAGKLEALARARGAEDDLGWGGGREGSSGRGAPVPPWAMPRQMQRRPPPPALVNPPTWGWLGCWSTRKCSSGVLVYRQTAAWFRAPDAPGKYLCTARRRVASSRLVM